MYEAILETIDSVVNSLGLASKERQVKKGVNPWGYFSIDVKEEGADRIERSGEREAKVEIASGKGEGWEDKEEKDRVGSGLRLPHD